MSDRAALVLAWLCLAVAITGFTLLIRWNMQPDRSESLSPGRRISSVLCEQIDAGRISCTIEEFR